MSGSQKWLQKVSERLRSWEAFLLVILLAIVIINSLQSPFYLSVGNQINLFNLSIEKIIVVLVMTFIIINAEIDLSVASMMGLAACVLGWLHGQGVPIWVGILVGLALGLLGGAFNGFWISYVGLPSLVVTLAMLIGYRGLARVFLEDRSIGEFPGWFDALGQKPLVGPFPLALIIFFVLLAIAIVVLQYSGFGRYVYVVGDKLFVMDSAGYEIWSHEWPKGETHAMPVFVPPDKIFASGAEGVIINVTAQSSKGQLINPPTRNAVPINTMSNPVSRPRTNSSRISNNPTPTNISHSHISEKCIVASPFISHSFLRGHYRLFNIITRSFSQRELRTKELDHLVDPVNPQPDHRI